MQPKGRSRKSSGTQDAQSLQSRPTSAKSGISEETNPDFLEFPWLLELAKTNSEMKTEVVERLMELPNDQASFLVREAIAAHTEDAPHGDLNAILNAAFERGHDSGSKSNSRVPPAHYVSGARGTASPRKKVTAASLEAAKPKKPFAWQKAKRGLARMRVSTVMDEIKEMHLWVQHVESKIRKETQPDARCNAKQVQIDGGTTTDLKHAMASEQESHGWKQKELVDVHGWEHLPAGVVEKRCWDYLQGRYQQVEQLRNNRVMNLGDAKPRQIALGQRASFMGEDNDEDSHLVDRCHGIPKAAMEHTDFWQITDARQLASRRVVTKEKAKADKAAAASASRTAAKNSPNVVALALSGITHQTFGSKHAASPFGFGSLRSEPPGKSPRASECLREGTLSVESPSHTAS
jgi:hypothetical protein